MFEASVLALMIIGLLASAVFVVTWTPFAIRALRRGHVHKAATLDFAGWPIAAFLILSIATIEYFWPLGDGWLRQMVVLSKTGFIALIAVVRAGRWILKLRRVPPDKLKVAVLDPAAGHRIAPPDHLLDVPTDVSPVSKDGHSA